MAPLPGYGYLKPEDHIMNLHVMETSNLKYFFPCRSGIAHISMHFSSSLTLGNVIKGAAGTKKIPEEQRKSSGTIKHK
jgi:hypothetical protein